MALAIVPCVRELNVRFLPVVGIWRKVQTMGEPTSATKIASSFARRPMVSATYCG